MPEIEKNSAEETPSPATETKAPKTVEEPKAPKAAKAAKEPKEPKEPKAAKAAKGPRRTQRTVKRRWPAVVGGASTLLVAAALVGAATVFPGSDATKAVTPVPHPLPVGEALANCQGPTQLLAGSAAGADPEFSANSSSTKTQLNAVVLSSSAGEIPGAGVQALDGKFSPLFTISEPPAATAEAGAKELTGKPKMRAEVEQGRDAAGASVLRVLPLGGEPSQGAGSVVVSSGDGDLKGLAAATCQAPSNEMWLSGASTTVGRTAVLMVSNSSASPATVSFELFSPAGPVQAAGSKGLVIPAGTVRSVVLAGLAPDQELLSVHLKSTGGAVSAVVQQSVLRGLTPGGVDYLAPVQAPSSTLVVPGVRVQAPATAAKISGQSGYADAATALAITVPGVRDAVVEVKAFGPDGQAALPNGGVFTAKAGAVSGFALAGLPEGTYALSLSSDAPVAAAVRLSNSTKPGEAVDLAWAPSAERLGDTHLATVPKDAGSRLVFTAPEGAATVQLVPVTAGGVLGEATVVDVKSGFTTTVDPASLGKDTAAVLISASGSPAFGTQLLSDGGSAGIAVLPIAGTNAGTQAIKITSGY